MDKVKVYSNVTPPQPVHEVCTSKDLGVLDKVSITKVTEFMHRYQADASFSPPTVDVLYDSDKYDVTVDDEVDSVFIDVEDMDDEIQRARENE